MKITQYLSFILLLNFGIPLFSQVDINPESIDIKSSDKLLNLTSHSNTGYDLSLHENEDLVFSETDVAPRLLLQKGGRVGINTLFPKSTLDISFPISAEQSEDGLVLNSSERKWRMTVGGDKTVNAAHYQLLYRNFNGTTYVPKLTVTHSGPNILGIGTNNPQATLDVAGSTRTESLTIDNVAMYGQTRMLTVDQDGNVGSQDIPASGTSSDSFLEIPILDQAGSNNGFLIENNLPRDISGFPIGPRVFEIYRKEGIAKTQLLSLSVNEELFVSKLKVLDQVIIGTNLPATGHILTVGGKIASEEVLVQLRADWPDYVFKEDYKLKSLTEVEEYIEEEGHLPGLPSALEVESKGIEVGEMNRLLLEKIEELTLHIIEQQKQIDQIKSQVEKTN